MDETHFDALIRVLGAGDSRRRLLGVLAALPVAGGLLAILEADDAEGKERRRRRKQRHKRRKNPGNRKRKHRKPCKPQPIEVTCAGKCGNVSNNCKKTVACGLCGCTPITCAEAGECGSFDDGCGGTLQCECPAGETCCDGACSPCPCGQMRRANGTCATPCDSAAPCGTAPCGCFATPGLCGNGGTSTGNLCPNGDIDCPLGQICNTFNGQCVFTCAT